MIENVCVYCGSSAGHDRKFASEAYDFGKAVAKSGKTLIYGGGHVGLMGAVANGALETGGKVVGVITEQLAAIELSHIGLTELITVPDMHVRKATMAQRADAFVALPGGIGTLEEIFEALTWLQLDIHRKPCVFLDGSGYFGSLFRFLDSMVVEGFLSKQHREFIVRCETQDEVWAALDDFVISPSRKRE